jgi:hypothetical protein
MQEITGHIKGLDFSFAVTPLQVRCPANTSVELLKQ